MMPCGMFASGERLNVFEDSFENVWEMVKLQTAMIRLPAKCTGCSYKDRCRSCAAMVYTETGCFDKAPEYRCEMMKSFDAQRKRVEKMVREEET